MVGRMSELRLRNAEKEDINLIYEWANDESERRNSFNTQKIEYADHCKWYANKLESDDTFIYVMMKDEEPVGQGRLELEGNKATISYFVDEKYRKKGIATLLYKEFEQIAKQSGAYQVRLCLWSFNREAEAFYRKMGMNEQRVIMEKNI